MWPCWSRQHGWRDCTTLSRHMHWPTMAPRWHAWLIGAAVAKRGAHPVAPVTPAWQVCRARRADMTSPYKGRDPARFSSLSPLSLHVLGSWGSLVSSKWGVLFLPSSICLWSSLHLHFRFEPSCAWGMTPSPLLFFVFSWCLYTTLVYTAVCNTSFSFGWKLLITSNILWFMLYLMNFYWWTFMIFVIGYGCECIRVSVHWFR
jgi:hypothetical protein